MKRARNRHEKQLTAELPCESHKKKIDRSRTQRRRKHSTRAVTSFSLFSYMHASTVQSASRHCTTQLTRIVAQLKLPAYLPCQRKDLTTGGEHNETAWRVPADLRYFYSPFSLEPSVEAGDEVSGKQQAVQSQSVSRPPFEESRWG